MGVSVETILAGDIGGTNARLAVFEAGDRDFEITAAKTYPARDYPDLETILARFLGETGLHPSVACLGVAGVIRRGVVEMVNLPWRVDAAVLSRKLAIPVVRLLNDLEAAAWGVEALEPAGEEILLEGEPDLEGNRCLCSPGTGLGEAGMVYTPEGHLPFRSEGGHVNFAPRDDLEIDLLRHLLERYGHVSYERVLSGPGLGTLYRFLRDTGRGTEPAWLAERLEGGTPGSVITELALSGQSEICSAALDLFVSIYGSAAGNLALKTAATGGVWLGGGIPPRILPRLRGSAFRKAFVSKGRLRHMMEKVPVRVVTDDRLALLGAARSALRFVRGFSGGGVAADP